MLKLKGREYMNKVVLIGRLVRNPELKFAPTTGMAVTRLTLAVDRRKLSKDGQKEADFIPVVLFGKTAENTANYMVKGSLLGVSGTIRTGSYDAKDGTKRYTTEIYADEVQFLDKKGSGQAPGQNNNTGSSFEDEFMTPIDDGDIPF